MAASTHIPLMKPGSTVRNIAIGSLYFFLLPLVIVLLPFWLLYAIGTNRHGLGDTVANSPLGRIPGVGSGGWSAGIVVFFLAIVLLIFIGAATPGGEAPENTPSPDSDDTPSAGSDSGGTSESNSDDGSESIQKLYSDSLNGLGLTTTVSETGEHIGYGLDNGNVRIYDPNGNGNTISFQADRSVSHLIISEETDRVIIGWMDLHRFGGASINGDDSWIVEYQGLWDLSPTPDMNTVAAVSSPAEGSGGTGLAIDGQPVWTTPMEDSTGLAVDIGDSGNGIAVGAGKEWAGAERQGTPGVHYYDSDGNLEWTHETEEDVLSVAVDEEEDIVVAGTDDGKLLAFNREGELLWENDEGGYVELSGDGSTIVSDNFGEVVAFNTEGEELWRESAETFGRDIEVSEDGTRVIVGSRGDGKATVIDEGETIWSESWDEGPIQVSISADGSTWSVIVQDNDEGISHVHAYRE